MNRKLLIMAICFAVVGCDRATDEGFYDDGKDNGGNEVREKMENGLAGLPGGVNRLFAESEIMWQPWGKEAFRKASEENRLVLALVVVPQEQDNMRLYELFEQNKRLAEEVNENYVPVMVDAGVVREWVPYVLRLLSETVQPIDFPFAIWLTSEARPVGWVALNVAGKSEAKDLFLNLHDTIMRLWQEDSSYVIENSDFNHRNRMQRIIEDLANTGEESDLEAKVLGSLRQLISQYDDGSRSFYGAGRLFPVGVIELLCLTVRMEELPAVIRERSGIVLGMLVEDMVTSGMFDPLDGGVFGVKKSKSWNHPMYYKSCEIQARVVSCLAEAYQVMGKDEILGRALEVLNHAERTYRTDSGVFGQSGMMGRRDEDFMWTMNDMKKLLSEEEARVWIEAGGIREEGNVPLEARESNKFFKLNNLHNGKDSEMISEKTGIDVEKISLLKESGRRKLLAERVRRTGDHKKVVDGEAVPSFRMVSAYAAMYRATGDAVYRERAVIALSNAREKFMSGRELRLYDSDAKNEISSARAFVYGLAIQAALDVEMITQDQAWRVWVEDLLSFVSEFFIVDGMLRESPRGSDILNMPMTNKSMIFEETTIGLFSIMNARMKKLGYQIPEPLREIGKYLPDPAQKTPIIYTDMIEAVVIQAYGDEIIYGDGSDDDTLKLLSRMPPKAISVRKSEGNDAGNIQGVIRIGSDGQRILMDRDDKYWHGFLPKHKEIR